MAKVLKQKHVRKQRRNPRENYHVVNWKEYDAALTRRGSVTFWFSEDIVKDWYHQHEANRQRGGQTIYSNTAILLCLTLKAQQRRERRTFPRNYGKTFVRELTICYNKKAARVHKRTAPTPFQPRFS